MRHATTIKLLPAELLSPRTLPFKPATFDQYEYSLNQITSSRILARIQRVCPRLEPYFLAAKAGRRRLLSSMYGEEIDDSAKTDLADACHVVMMLAHELRLDSDQNAHRGDSDDAELISTLTEYIEGFLLSASEL